MKLNVFDLELVLYYCLPLFLLFVLCFVAQGLSHDTQLLSRIDHSYSLPLFLVVNVLC